MRSFRAQERGLNQLNVVNVALVSPTELSPNHVDDLAFIYTSSYGCIKMTPGIAHRNVLVALPLGC